MARKIKPQQLELFPEDPGPADPVSMRAMAAVAIPRAALQADGYRPMMKYADLLKLGYSICVWLQPVTKDMVYEMNPCHGTDPRARAGMERLTFRTFEEQAACHRAIGANVTGPGREYR